VVFPILPSSNPSLLETSCVIWTITAWTLPANRAIAYCLETAYVVLEVIFVTDEERTAFSGSPRPRISFVCNRAGIGEYKIL
jgi:isoleucyl-tRNA synthetase